MQQFSKKELETEIAKLSPAQQLEMLKSANETVVEMNNAIVEYLGRANKE
ncbi:MAG: hypothetical protein WCJ51_00395 [Candidatus Moraniibacteriota bacterium]